MKSPASSAYTKSSGHRLGGTRVSDLRGFSTCKIVQIRKAEYDKLRQDPDALKAHLAQEAAYRMRRFKSDPEARLKDRVRARQWHRDQSSTHKSHRAVRHNLRNWVSAFIWVRESLPWKSHQPLYHQEPVEHYCDGCRLVRGKGFQIEE
jgi:hypothetical protein